MTRDEAAAYVRKTYNQKCTAGYLGKLASIGGGPLFYRVGGRVDYQPPHLDTWAQSRINGPLCKASDARRAA